MIKWGCSVLSKLMGWRHRVQVPLGNRGVTASVPEKFELDHRYS